MVMPVQVWQELKFEPSICVQASSVPCVYNFDCTLNLRTNDLIPKPDQTYFDTIIAVSEQEHLSYKLLFAFTFDHLGAWLSGRRLVGDIDQTELKANRHRRRRVHLSYQIEEQDTILTMGCTTPPTPSVPTARNQFWQSHYVTFVFGASSSRNDHITYIISIWRWIRW